MPTLGCPGMITLIAHARAIAPAERSAEPADAPTANDARSGQSRDQQGATHRPSHYGGLYLPSCSRANARKRSRAASSGPRGLLVRVLRIGGDLLRDGPHLVRERLVMRRARSAAPRPSSRSRRSRARRGRRAAARAGGRSECRRTCGTRECGAATRRARRSRGSRRRSAGRSSRSARRPAGSRARRSSAIAPNYGCFPRARHAICAAVRIRSTAKSFRSTCSGSDSATCAPPTVAPIEATPITRAGRQRTLP